MAPNIGRIDSWAWAVHWPGWFDQRNYVQGRQEAADAATNAWWACVATEVPRDIEAEVLLIAARVLVRPPPNSLYDEDSAFLKRLMDTVRLQYAEELKNGALPLQVKDLMTNLSQELFRRRTRAGEN